MSAPDSHNPFAAPKVQEQASEIHASGIDFTKLKGVGLGLKLIYFALLIFVVLILGIVGAFAGSFGGVAFFGRIGLPLVGLAIVGIYILATIGLFLCTTVPAESGARTLAWICTVLHCFQVIAMFYTRFAGFAGLGLLGLAGQISGTVLLLLFVLFMRKVAVYMGRSDLMSRATRVLILMILVAGGFIVFLVMAWTAPQQGMRIALSGLFLFLSLIVFVTFSNLVNELSKAIRNPDTPIANHIG